MRWLIIFLLVSFPCFAGIGINPSTGDIDLTIDIAEEDGTPTVYAPETLKVTNGTLTDNGDGTASLSISASETDTLDTVCDRGSTTDQSIETTGDVTCDTLNYTTLNPAISGGDFSDGGDTAGADRTIGNNDNYDLGIETNGTTAIHIQNDGNVGIGTTAPDNELEIKGTGTAKAVYSPLTVTNDVWQADDDGTGAGLNFRMYADTTAVDSGGVYVVKDKDWVDGSPLTQDGNLEIYTVANGVPAKACEYNWAGNLFVGKQNVNNYLEVGYNSSYGMKMGFTGGYPYLQFLDTAAPEAQIIVDNDRLGINDKTPEALLDIGGGGATSINGDDDLLVKDDLEVDGDSYFEGAITTAGQKIAVVSKTGTYTATENDEVIICNANGGAFTITLPIASSSTGVRFYIKKIDSSANAVTIDGNGSQTIDDSTTQALSSQYDALEIVCDGTEWWIISSY